MKITTNQVLKDYEGKDIIEESAKGEKRTITIRDVFSVALNTQTKDEVITAEEKAKVFQISTKLYTGNEVDLTVDQLSLIKERVGKIYNPLVYGRVCELIDGQPTEVVDKQ